MKKIFLISVFLAAVVAYGYGQTYYYKAVAQFDKDGAKSKPNLIANAKGMYITFSDNKNVCYWSDENGYRYSFYNTVLYQITTARNYYFQKTQNGTHVYGEKEYNLVTMRYEWGICFYYFSSDFSKFQQATMNADGSTYSKIEYVRTNGPQDDYDDIPTF